MTEEQAFLDAIYNHPDEPRHLNAFLDWLGERDDERLPRVRWWLEYCQRAPGLIDWSRECEWSEVERSIGRCPESVRPLGCVLLFRTISEKYPVSWSKLTTWPEGWSSERCRKAIRQSLHALEWRFLGFVQDIWAVAMWGARAAKSAAESTTESPTESLEPGAWAAWSGAWAASSVEVLARLASRSAQSSPDSGVWSSALLTAGLESMAKSVAELMVRSATAPQSAERSAAESATKSLFELLAKEDRP